MAVHPHVSNNSGTVAAKTNKIRVQGWSTRPGHCRCNVGFTCHVAYAEVGLRSLRPSPHLPTLTVSLLPPPRDLWLGQSGSVLSIFSALRKSDPYCMFCLSRCFLRAVPLLSPRGSRPLNGLCSQKSSMKAFSPLSE